MVESRRDSMRRDRVNPHGVDNHRVYTRDSPPPIWRRIAALCAIGFGGALYIGAILWLIVLIATKLISALW